MKKKRKKDLKIKKNKEFEAWYKQGLIREQKKIDETPTVEHSMVLPIVPVKKQFFSKPALRPDIDKHWTTVYYGARGSCKSIHQAKQTKKVLEFMVSYYKNNPTLNQSIVFTNQKLNKSFEIQYLGTRLFYWTDLSDIENCPRKNCWKSKKAHRLHGCYLFFDDIASILPSGNYRIPNWLRKLFSQARHNGIKIVANLQDPFSCHIDFRRYIDMAYKFTKIIGNKDPDETKKPLKYIFGIYRRRKIDAETLWRYGDLPEQTIRLMLMEQEEENKRLKEAGKEMQIVYSDSWLGTYHWYTKKHCTIYDTLQDVEKYDPKGFAHKELSCIDPAHPNCGFKKVSHELI